MALFTSPRLGARGSLAAESPASNALVAAEPRERWWRWARAMVVGGGATIADLGTLAFLVRLLLVHPILARAIALAAGWLVLFFGSRSFAFRAQAGNMPRQATLFILSEIAGMPLNLLLFVQCQRLLPDFAPEVVGMGVNSLTFVAYHYPVRRYLVFRIPKIR